MRTTRILVVFVLLLSSFNLFSQDDSVKVMISSKEGERVQNDTNKIIEDAALDIGQNRGLFIVTPDKKLQLRILGSVRYLVVYDNKKMESKNGFSTYEIPTGSESRSFPSLYNGLEQTRLGFEITRSTLKGNVFVRLETDFRGVNGYRIRHAYGQFQRFLVGQTWSLFSHITSTPATVDFNAPTGASSVRTPQIRYTFPSLLLKYDLSIALEYYKPEINLPDTLAIEPFLLIPDVTARFENKYNWGQIQLSGLLTVLSGRVQTNKQEALLGWGAAVSTVIKPWEKGSWYLQGLAGQGITRYVNDLEGKGLDLIIDPNNNQNALLPYTFGGFITYQHTWSEKVLSNFSYGGVFLQNFTFTPFDAYRWGNTLRVNTFWSAIEGAKLGFEGLYGVRYNRDGSRNDAVRVNLLVYYDF